MPRCNSGLTGPLAPLNDVSQEGHSRHRCPVRGDHSE
nr:MAG TPA_asm: hypothetical protein [Caudoviricetes sp.]